MMHGSGHVMRGFGHGFMANGQNGWMGEEKADSAGGFA